MTTIMIENEEHLAEVARRGAKRVDVLARFRFDASGMRGKLARVRDVIDAMPMSVTAGLMGPAASRLTARAMALDKLAAEELRAKAGRDRPTCADCSRVAHDCEIGEQVCCDFVPGDRYRRRERARQMALASGAVIGDVVLDPTPPPCNAADAVQHINDHERGKPDRT